MAVRKLSQKAVGKLYFSFASYCPGSVTSKVSNSCVSTPRGIASSQAHWSMSGHYACMRMQLQIRRLGGAGQCVD